MYFINVNEHSGGMGNLVKYDVYNNQVDIFLEVNENLSWFQSLKIDASESQVLYMIAREYNEINELTVFNTITKEKKIVYYLDYDNYGFLNFDINKDKILLNKQNLNSWGYGIYLTDTNGSPLKRIDTSLNSEMTENALFGNYAVWSGWNSSDYVLFYYDFINEKEYNTGIVGEEPRIYNNTILYMTGLHTTNGQHTYYVSLLSLLDEDDDGIPDSEDKCPNTIGAQIIYGCSCEQILVFKPGKNNGELKNECSKGTINVFTKNIG